MNHVLVAFAFLLLSFGACVAALNWFAIVRHVERGEKASLVPFLGGTSMMLGCLIIGGWAKYLSPIVLFGDPSVASAVLAVMRTRRDRT